MLDGDLCSDLDLKGNCATHQNCFCLCFEASEEGFQVESAYFGELGYELILFSPFLNFLRERGQLRKTVGPIGSSPFYFFSSEHEEVSHSRDFCRGPQANPTPHEDNFDFSTWQPPALKAHYTSQHFMLEKPTFIVHNKYSTEWGGEPANFIDIPTLISLVGMLKTKYSVVYLRPRGNEKGYTGDNSNILGFDDHESLKEAHPETLFAHDLMTLYKHDAPYNLMQLYLHANCDDYISVQGGNSVLSSYFAKRNIIYAVRGFELAHPTEYTEIYPQLNVEQKNQTHIVVVDSYASLLTAAQELYMS